MGDVWIARHGETDWSARGRHTGRTDLDLTDRGRRDASRRAAVLDSGRPFALVLTSPMRRATETARLAGFAPATDPDGPAIVDPDLREWDYGGYEGRTTAEIRATVPAWTVWTHPVPEGETIDEVADRARRVLDRCSAVEGNVALFGHGHQLRVLTALRLGFPPTAGAAFALEAGTVGVLGHEHGTPALRAWNLRCVAP